MNFRRGQIHAHRDIVQSSRTNPSGSRLNGVQYREEQVATRWGPDGNTAVHPGMIANGGFRAAKHAIDSRFFRNCCPVFSQVEVHSALLKLVNPDGRCLKLGGSRFGIDGIDREIVCRHLIVKMKR